mgnify:CR=1 FL=1
MSHEWVCFRQRSDERGRLISLGVLPLFDRRAWELASRSHRPLWLCPQVAFALQRGSRLFCPRLRGILLPFEARAVEVHRSFEAAAGLSQPLEHAIQRFGSKVLHRKPVAMPRLAGSLPLAV